VPGFYLWNFGNEGQKNKQQYEQQLEVHRDVMVTKQARACRLLSD